MQIKLYNSLTDKIENFTPLVAGEVSLYVCGPTVYDFVHVGNLRPVVVFDTLSNFFRYLGYHVKHVSNYTDVDDKIIAKAKADGISEKAVADKFIAAFEQNLAAINAQLPTHAPRVTEFMPEMINFIQALIDVGAAYHINGNVYFRVASDPKYGELSNAVADDLQVGARIEENTEKLSPLDFALWKKTDQGLRWPSPWGEGRPGWHTECVVMIDSIFPKKFIDIHGGGFDLKFPHHENEIAQSRALNNNTLAQIWMHNGFINVDNQKMSKSIGNVVTASDALHHFGGNAIRLMLLESHYRAPANFTEEVARSAQIEVDKLLSTFKQLSTTLQEAHCDLALGKASEMATFLSALADDFNTPNAISELFALVKSANMELRKSQIDHVILLNYFASIRDMLMLLGIKVQYRLLNEDDLALLANYRQAKKAKDFGLSDQLRTELIQREIF